MPHRHGPPKHDTHESIANVAKQLSFEKTWTVMFGLSWQNIKPVCQISTIADFWGLLNNTCLPRSSPMKCDIHIFHSGIAPEWEAPENQDGGKWCVDLGIERTTEVDDVWLRILMGLVGEQYAENSSAIINGVTLALRPHGIRGSVWTRKAPLDVQRRVGESIRSIAEVPASVEMEFKWHKESISNGSCFQSKAALKV